VNDRHKTNTFISTSTLKCPMCKSAHALHKCDKFSSLMLQDRRALVTRYNFCFNCMKKDTGLVNVLTHIIVSNVRSTTIHSYIRIAGDRCRRLLRLKQTLQGLRKRVRLLQNQSMEATLALKNSVHLKSYVPQPQQGHRLARFSTTLQSFT
jgi:hypothetical protein